MIAYDKVMHGAIALKSSSVKIDMYRKKAELLTGNEWATLIKKFSDIIKLRKTLNRGPKCMSYKQLKGRLSDFAINAGLGHVKGTPDTYHGIIYTLVKLYDIELHRVVTSKSTTYWLMAK